MSPGEHGLRNETIDRYIGLLNALDQALSFPPPASAGDCHAALLAFVRELPHQERALLEARSGLPGWSSRRRRRLKARWEALQLHGGTWRGWREQLESKDCPLGHFRRQEALREAAKDLVCAASPGEHRAALWRFCAAGIVPKVPSRAVPQRDDRDRDQYEQIWLDVRRTPHLQKGQMDVLMGVLVAYCSRRAVQGGALFDPYVQGMHMLAACPLWAGFDAADALLLFEFALERLCGPYYSDPSFGLFKRDVIVTEALIEEKLPHLAAAFRAASVPTMSLAFDPLLCLFTNHLPSSIALRFWDFLLLEGDAALFALLLLLLEELLPEAAAAPTWPSAESVVRWDGFPFVERFHERSAALAPAAAESLLLRAKVLLEGEGKEAREDHGGLRWRLHELRRQAAQETEVGQEGCVGAWWGQFRGWWEEEEAAGNGCPTV